jgi:dolichol-phosphate mannosyltransferase
VVIPARDEEGSVEETLRDLVSTLSDAQIPHEVILVDDGSQDATISIVTALTAQYPQIRLVKNAGRHGFGMAIRCGLECAAGDAIAIMMADRSDSSQDLVACYHKLGEGFDCVFGSRFIPGSKVVDYPRHKLILNRLANSFIKVLFGLNFNDYTNAFKLYRRYVIDGMQPLISPHFNLTVEMPLKAIVRGYNFGVIPITWTNRKAGASKLKIKEMGSRYLFIVLYLWLEKALSRGDYHRPANMPAHKDLPHA